MSKEFYNKRLSALDHFLVQADQALRTLAGSAPQPKRKSPALDKAEAELQNNSDNMPWG